MSREFKEETGVETSPEDWTLQCQLSGKDFTVDVYRIFTDDIFQAETMEDEKVVIYPIGLELITAKGISNLPWLVAMALDEDAERFQPTISYVNK
jgi:8-oxo-dGTP pyrophosphatase MutT (NUDIX family)